jgi:hypothetical protein
MIDLSDGGFLVDPTQPLFHPRVPPPSALSTLQHYQALVLLGEPGMGKSMTLKTEATRLATAASDGDTVSIHLDLRAFSSEALLYQKVFESPALIAWKNGASRLVLHLDSLDEALLRIDSVANLISAELPHLPTDRLSVRIACRTAVWPELTLEPALKQIWGNEAVGVFELAPLRRVDVATAAMNRGISAQAFIEELYAANVVSFAIKPLTLNMLLGLYQRDGHLPRSIADLYAMGCLKLCEEQNASRRDTRNLGGLSPDQRLRLAGRIAAVTMFANRYAIWTGAETDPIPDGDLPLSKLTTGEEKGDFQPFPADIDHIREALDTGLFTSRGVSRMGWAHLSYAEFLAAFYLIAKGTPANNILKLLLHPSGGLVPQLATVAAWAASLNEEVRKGLISLDPMALLKGDLVNWSNEDLAALTASLLDAYDRQRIHDFLPGAFNIYPRLAHPGLASQLKTYVTDKTKDVYARRIACSIGEACELKVLQPELLVVALDATEDYSLRARAVSALGKCGDDSIADSLLPLAKGELGPDPTNDIKGQALEFLWPNHITAAELFSMLTHPNEGYFGAYAMFLTEQLPKTLSAADLSPALGWATGFVKGLGYNGHDFHRKSLADAILVACWNHFERSELSLPFVEHVLVRIQDGGELFRSTAYRRRDAFFEELETDVEKRRGFLVTAVKRGVQKMEAYWLMRARFLTRSDFRWLLSASPHGSSPVEGADEQTLCNMIESTFDWDDPAQFESLFAIATQWEQLRQRYIGLLDGVVLDSAEVKQGLENRRLMKELEREKDPPLDPPPIERVRDCLKRYESGELAAWWHLHLEMTLEPQSTHYGGDQEFLISGMPGWRDADAQTRARIVAAAESYLDNAQPFVSEWLGSGSYRRDDYAAYRGLILLQQSAPEIYCELGSELWRKWAPLVAAVDRLTGAKEAELHDDIMADASSAAPVEFAETVQRLIRTERINVPKLDDNTRQLTPFFILGRLTKCWGSATLRNVVFKELQDAANSPAQFQALLEPMVGAGFEPAREYAVGLLSDVRSERRDYVLAAAYALAKCCMGQTWPDIWNLVRGRPDVGEDLFLRLANLARFQAPFYAALPPSALADLYVWLQRRFPHSDDPNRQGGMPHYVGPREMVGDMRDGVLAHIVELGTDASLQALRGIIGQLPDLTWLPLQLSRAEQIMRTKTWAPLTPSDVLRVTSSPRGRLVQSAEDLCEALVEALQHYQDELHGAQTPVQFLWSSQIGGTLKPVDENAISDHVELFLKRELVESGVVLNREVEVGRVPGAPVGSRTDIKVDAVRHGERDETYNVISAVIETKGCWNRELLTAARTQLRDDYLVRLGAPVGIYLAAWFDKAKWDPRDGRKKQAPSWDLEETRRRLNEKVDELPKGFIIRAVVLDCHAS